jgi:hypothetical protein
MMKKKILTTTELQLSEEDAEILLNFQSRLLLSAKLPRLYYQELDLLPRAKIYDLWVRLQKERTDELSSWDRDNDKLVARYLPEILFGFIPKQDKEFQDYTLMELSQGSTEPLRIIKDQASIATYGRWNDEFEWRAGDYKQDRKINPATKVASLTKRNPDVNLSIFRGYDYVATYGQFQYYARWQAY